jgi:hypothetical protein
MPSTPPRDAQRAGSRPQAGLAAAPESVGTISVSSWALLGDEDDFADVAPLGDEPVSVGRPVEREGLGDDWL